MPLSAAWMDGEMTTPSEVSKRGREIDRLQVQAINSYQSTHLQTDSQT